MPQILDSQAPSPGILSVRRIGAAPILVIEQTQALAMLAQAVARKDHLKIAFANAHFLNVAAQDAAFCAALPHFSILPDGLGVDLASKLLYGETFPANLNGTDFVPLFLRWHALPLRVGLIGAGPGIAEKAALRLAGMAPQHDIRVISNGYFTATQEADLLTRLAEDPVDVVLVAMGNPVQEKWIARCITPAHAHVVMGVGALFDFLAGNVVRAPETIRRFRLEWVWRLAQEPGRLWRRYILGNPLFLLRVIRQKLFESAR